MNETTYYNMNWNHKVESESTSNSRTADPDLYSIVLMQNICGFITQYYLFPWFGHGMKKIINIFISQTSIVRYLDL